MRLVLTLRPPQQVVLLVLAWALAGLSIAYLAGPLQLASQWPWRRALAEQVISLQIGGDGRLQLLGQPADLSQLDRRLLQTKRRTGWRSVRLIPAPEAPWGRVLQLYRRFDQAGWTVELQLPSP